MLSLFSNFILLCLLHFFTVSGVGLLSLAAGAFAAKKWPTLAK
jgi:hypothetical protein